MAVGMPLKGPLPSIPIALYQMIINWVLMDTLFYWVHRAFHTWPYLYKTIHSKHHRFTASVSWAAEFAHPVETVLANTIPTGMFLHYNVHSSHLT